MSLVRRFLATVTGRTRPVSLVPSFKVRLVLQNVYQVHFARQSQLASTFLRFQEHHESPKFLGQIFTRQEFEQWYASENGGQFSYLSDWSGFNLPSDVLVPFLAGRFDPLSEEEQHLLEYFRRERCLKVVKKRRKPANTSGITTAHNWGEGLQNGGAEVQNESAEDQQQQQQEVEDELDGEPFYIIGTYGRFGFVDSATLKHELCHALFNLDRQYREQVLQTLQTVDLSRFHRYLTKLGYHENVILDEVNAYIVADKWIFRRVKASQRDFAAVNNALELHFKKAVARASPAMASAALASSAAVASPPAATTPAAATALVASGDA